MALAKRDALDEFSCSCNRNDLSAASGARPSCQAPRCKQKGLNNGIRNKEKTNETTRP
jgi:hypothetical protein